MIKKRQAKHVRSYLETSNLKRKRRRKRIFARIIFLTIFGCLMIGFIFLLRSKVLQVDTIEVTGAVQVSTSEVQEKTMNAIATSKHIFGLVPSTNTLFVDEERLEKMIVTEFPVVESVSVHTGLGGKVNIAVTERKMASLWCDSSMSNCYQMDRTGYLFFSSQAPTSDQLIFKGMLNENEHALIGQKFLSGKELSVFENAKTALAATGKKVDYVLCDSPIFCVIKIADNGRLRVNPHDDLVNAFDRLSSALKSPELANEKFEYIDLRYGSKLFYKLDNGLTNTSMTSSVSSSTTPIPGR